MNIVAFLYVGLLALYAAYGDVRAMIIPNWISIALLGGFIVYAVVLGLPLHDVLWRVGISVAVFLVGLALFYIRAMGGGDVKLLTALTVWIEPHAFLTFIFLVSTIGAALAILKILLVYLKLRRSGEPLTRSAFSRAEIPYGVAIAIAAILAMPPVEFHF